MRPGSHHRGIAVHGNYRRESPNLGPLLGHRELLPGFGTFAVVVSALALIGIMAVNADGAMLTTTSAVDALAAEEAAVAQSARELEGTADGEGRAAVTPSG